MKRYATILCALWRKELTALSRDRHGLLALFIMPAAFILIMSLALQDAFSGHATRVLRYAVVDLDNSQQSRQLLERLAEHSEFERIGAADDPSSARQAVRNGHAGAALIVPRGFGTAPPGKTESPALRLLTDPALTPAVLQAFRGAVQTSLLLGTIDELAKRVRRARPAAASAKPSGNATTSAAPFVEIETASGDAHTAQPSAVQQSVPAWLIFSMFFVVIPLSSIFIAERRDGTLQRLRSQQIPFVTILVGKLLPFWLVNQIQALLMVLVGMYLVPLAGGEALLLPDAWFPLWLVACAVSLAAVCWALLVATLTRTSEQATVVGGIGNILMGAVGGIMVPKTVMPATMQSLTAFSPMSWALDGFHHVMLRQGGIGDILGSAAALLVFALSALVVALLIYWWRTQP